MRRWLVLCLAACLLLAGCGKGAEETTAEPTQAETLGLYDPQSTVEEKTAGGVKAYPLEQSGYSAVTGMGSKLLLTAEDGSAAVVGGSVNALLAQTQIVGMEGLTTAQTGAAYYHGASNQVVLLNPQLQQTGEISLPKEAEGTPYIALAQNTVYYTTPGMLMAMDLETGISRRIRAEEGITLTGCHMDGQVLGCTVANGQQVYISSQTGQNLWQDQVLAPFFSAGSHSFLGRTEGSQQQYIAHDGEKALLVTLPEGSVEDGLNMGAVVCVTRQEGAVQLSVYDLFRKGNCISALELKDLGKLVDLYTAENGIWLLMDNVPGYSAQVLYFWDTAATPVTEETVYTAPLRTADQPDEAGIAACQERAEAMQSTYGVKLHIWQDGVKNPGEHTLTVEYQVETIEKMLTSLEAALQQFPENFLRRTVESGWIRICLVRSIDGGLPYAQYWADGDCYIVIADHEDAGGQFLRSVGYGVDAHVLGNSRKLDDWSTLNPKGFSYDMSYDLYESREETAWLEGEEQTFIDSFGMTYLTEDRCQIFWAAMREGNGELFAKPALQSKLRLLCRGIREAYGLEKSKDTYLWEQYLTESLVKN